MPIPVSVTRISTVTQSPVAWPAGSMRSTTSPRSVNLIAFEVRFTRIWRTRPGSPRSRPGTSGEQTATSSRPLAWADGASSRATSSTRCRGSKPTSSSSSLPGLDLGEVQDVVDDGQQRLTRAAQTLGQRPLVGVEVGVEQKLGQADDAVHRRTDLVAHGGQELRLQARRLHGLVTGHGQGLLGALALADVLDEGVEEVRLATGDLPDGQLDGELVAVAMQGHELDAPADDGRLAGVEEPPQPVTVRVAQGDRDDRVGDLPAHDVGRGPSRRSTRRCGSSR